ATSSRQLLVPRSSAANTEPTPASRRIGSGPCGPSSATASTPSGSLPPMPLAGVCPTGILSCDFRAAKPPPRKEVERHRPPHSISRRPADGGEAPPRSLLGDRLAVGLRTLTPPTLVRIQVPQPNLPGHRTAGSRTRSRRTHAMPISALQERLKLASDVI